MLSSDVELCDWSSFNAALDKSSNRVSIYRSTLATCNETLAKRFYAGAPVTDLVRARAWLVDKFLTKAWEQSFEAQISNMALVAVGGYGRGELHPASDIDLLILLDNKHKKQLAAKIEAFLRFLWDIGLEVGHSVRSIKECAKQGKNDITIATNLMEARLITGSLDQFNQMKDRVGPKRIWSSRNFFKAKLDEQLKRHHHYNDTSYNLEPNIKEAPGGLRDLQVIGWIAKRHFSATSLLDLVGDNFLTQQEFDMLDEYQNFLWKIRFGLHTLSGRREDRLLFNYQHSLAELFGYKDSSRYLAVEQFMKDYYQTVMDINRLNEMLLQLFEEVILNIKKRKKVKPINKRFQEHNGYIEITHNNTFTRYPFALLEIFLILAQNPKLKGVRAETIRSIRHHRYLIDDSFRNDIRCHSLFMEIFRQQFGLTHELRRMNRYGILREYLPAFGKIVGQMQHDLFHIYTVDEHIMFTVRNLRRLTVTEFAHEFPVCSKLIKKIPKPELLYLAGVFHDIGKGRGGDHSKLGAKDAIVFCQHHDLSEHDTRLVAWLVENHLVMSMTAQRKDISDPAVIKEFAHLVSSQNNLDYLFLLTVADIRATNTTLWNSWKDALLTELYHATTHAFRHGLTQLSDNEKRIRDIKTQALIELNSQQQNEHAIWNHWDSMEDDYFIRHSVAEVIWHTTAILSSQGVLPLVLIREHTQRGGTELFVCTEDDKYVFALITSTLDKLGLTIIDARITTSKLRYTLDTFIVLEKSGEIIRDPHRIDEIKQRLTQKLSQPNKEQAFINRTKQPLSRQLQHFPLKTQVHYENTEYKQQTTMEVICRDQPGLLAEIALAMVECKIRLHNAKIATFGERVEDIFYITDPHNKPLSSTKQETLRASIIKHIDG